jgi:hypothetical protein
LLTIPKQEVDKACRAALLGVFLYNVHGFGSTQYKPVLDKEEYNQRVQTKADHRKFAEDVDKSGGWEPGLLDNAILVMGDKSYPDPMSIRPITAVDYLPVSWTSAAKGQKINLLNGFTRITYMKTRYARTTHQLETREERFQSLLIARDRRGGLSKPEEQEVNKLRDLIREAKKVLEKDVILVKYYDRGL